jgi:hypothetical protein
MYQITLICIVWRDFRWRAGNWSFLVPAAHLNWLFVRAICSVLFPVANNSGWGEWRIDFNGFTLQTKPLFPQNNKNLPQYSLCRFLTKCNTRYLWFNFASSSLTPGKACWSYEEYVTPCNSEITPCFEGIYYLYLHGWRVSQAKKYIDLFVQLIFPSGFYASDYFVIFLRPSWQMLEQYSDYVTTSSFQILTQSSFYHSMP